jgi:uncharacterized protein YijF (DUF1287 family)
MKKIYYIILLIISFACSVDYETTELENGIKKDFVLAALERTKNKITYNGDYFSIEYPNGDIPKRFGVCTDVIIRSYRQVNIDLQKLLHEDIRDNFSDYPIKRHWPSQRNPDSNIDHRRVPNLEVFFSKYGKSLPISNNKDDYKPGDIITWDLKGSSPWHIGIVTNKISPRTNNPLIVHNIGRGPVIDDMIFNFPIRGHYRYFPVSNK